VTYMTRTARQFTALALSVTSAHGLVKLPLPSVLALHSFDVFGLVTPPGMQAMTADESTQIKQALNGLRLHWDEAYKITHHPGEAEPCHAERLDDGTLLTAGSPGALRNKVIDDYSVRPVPRMNTTPAPTTRPGTELVNGTANAEERPDAC
jgi:hypothetical protein